MQRFGVYSIGGDVRKRSSGAVRAPWRGWPLPSPLVHGQGRGARHVASGVVCDSRGDGHVQRTRVYEFCASERKRHSDAVRDTRRGVQVQGARVREIRDAAPAVVLDTHSKRLMNIESMLLAAWEKLDRENEIERARRSDVGYTNTDVKPFAWCDVDDAEALVLMKRPTVTYLNLEFNTITDAGLTAIAEALGESNVKGIL